MTAAALEVVTATDDALCEFGSECPPLLSCKQVEAKCTAVHKYYFAPYRQWKLVFDFSVFEPIEHAKTKLQMFVRKDEKWTHPPVGSKLWKVSAVALGRAPRKIRITTSMFVGGLFRCNLKTIGKGPAAYSIIETITERLVL